MWGSCQWSNSTDRFPTERVHAAAAGAVAVVGVAVVTYAFVAAAAAAAAADTVADDAVAASEDCRLPRNLLASWCGASCGRSLEADSVCFFASKWRRLHTVSTLR